MYLNLKFIYRKDEKMNRLTLTLDVFKSKAAVRSPLR